MTARRALAILLLAAACTGSKAAKSEWTIGDISRAALESLSGGADEDEEAEPDSAFDGEGEDDEAPLFGGMAEEGGPPEPAEEMDLDGVTSGLDDGANSNFKTDPRFKANAKTKGAPKTWRRSKLVPNTSKLAIGTKEELPLEATHFTVRVDGFRARVVLDLFYRNDRDKQLEGTLKLRLPESASPDYTAFGVTAKAAFPESPKTSLAGIRGRMEKSVKEARMVPRQKAARAYGETVRKKIDPMLVEWAGAGVYNVKVFPLEPGKLHQITVAYDMDLVPVGDDLEYRLDIPEKAGKAKVALEVNTAAGHTVNGELAPTGRTHYGFDGAAERTVVVRVNRPGEIVLTGNDAAVGDLYAFRFTPEIPDEAGNANSDAIFLLDTSLSNDPDQFNVWLGLMRMILDTNRGSLRRFRVAFFNLETHWWRDGAAVANTEANVADLMRYAKTLALEGATDIGQALAAAAKIERRNDLFLMSDGAATWGERNPVALHGRIADEHTLFAYTLGLPGADARALHHLARESGGAVFSVTGEADWGKAAVAHTKRPWEILGVDAPGSDHLLRGRPVAVYPGQTLVLAGRGRLANSDSVKLRLRQGGRTIDVGTAVDQQIDSPLAAGVYGQIAVAQLEEFAHLTERESRGYALHFRVVGKSCSLLMLESEDDYKAYGIKPADEAEFVKAHPASATVRAVKQRRATELESPRARLAAWLERLEGSGAADFEDTKFVRQALDATVAGDFELSPGAFLCASRLRLDIPGSIQEQVAARKLDYVAIVAEAERRKTKYGAADGLKALSSLVEQSPGDPVVARDVGFTALGWGLGGEAYYLFRRVAEMRPHEPHNYVAMAQCLDALGRPRLAKVWYEVALAADWDDRFGEFRNIATVHYLSFLRRHKDDRLETLVPAFEPKAADLVVTVFWNTDRDDIDLHVSDPTGEVCSYNHNKTKMGGRLTQDVTSGFGPEMFILPHALPGEYLAWMDYFADDDTKTSTRSRVFATIFENWGRENERVHRRTVVLDAKKEQQPIAKMTRNQ
ncbi:MAG: hypothetical protein ACYTGZ_16250 [Planctomycetota bacterium]|jgi:hypothetical protein